MRDEASEPLRLDHAALSDIGLRRSNNQDSMASVVEGDSPRTDRGDLFIVADGMGAHAAGELASRLAAETVAHAYYKIPDLDPPDALRQALLEANARIHDRGQASPDFHGMGTTASTLALSNGAAWVGHVGDSRVYRLRGGQFDQLTFDHSLVWEMTAAGQLSKDAVTSFIPRNIITRSLGPNAQVQVDVEGPVPLEIGDTFLLCSDGLSGQVSDREMGAVLLTMNPQEAVRTLVDLANLRGGPDNVTVIVVRVLGHGGAAPAAARPTLPRAINPWPWLICGVSAFLAAILLYSENWPLGGFFAILAGGAATWAFTRPDPRAAAADEPPVSPPPRGRAPYVSVDCRPSAALVAEFARLTGQLREAASEEKWKIDWPRFEALQHSAMAASEQQRLGDALHEYSRAISFMMSELRKQTAG
jgi:protein phosphatase